MKKYIFKPKKLKFISLVTDPANEVEALLLSRTFELFSNKNIGIVYGVVLRPDYPIYRRDETGEYTILFTKEDIYDLYTEFDTDIKFDVEHNNEAIPVKILDSFIVDKDNRFGVESGSWILSVKVPTNLDIEGFSPEISGVIEPLPSIVDISIL